MRLVSGGGKDTGIIYTVYIVCTVTLLLECSALWASGVGKAGYVVCSVGAQLRHMGLPVRGSALDLMESATLVSHISSSARMSLLQLARGSVLIQ